METRQLGRTGIEVSRIGISSSFGADCGVFEDALERGCTYFTWGTFIRGRSEAFRTFMRSRSAKARREELTLALLSYSHSRLLGDVFLHSALRKLGTEYIDCLILGYFSRRPPQRLLDWAQEAKQRGLVRLVGITTHQRRIVAPLAREGMIDVIHFRYNAIHRGAEEDIFPLLGDSPPGMVSFTATSWGRLLDPRKMPKGEEPPTAGDCYRFVLANPAVDVCMMGVRNRAMLADNLDQVARGPMTGPELARMRNIGDTLKGRRRG